jgi:transcriptional regulator with XRE-family HTH domain
MLNQPQKMSLGYLLRKAREAKNMTTTFVALRVDIAPSVLILIEKGEKYPTPEYFLDLCKLLGADQEKAWKLLRDEKLKFYEQRLSREYQVSPAPERRR